MTLDELERLAKEYMASYPHNTVSESIAAADAIVPNVLSLLCVVRAAVEWRNHPCPANVEVELCLAVDALAALNLKDET